ncbi:coiled-coil domain-containing protein 32 isoform X2 [Hyperolius riggenbachi]|uniref:coiled-coil domain-containing protein 32 isoform X2 n=1 Tax=Hyperolius riggenbachi TaxID=752182 RepID=UPI0035A37EF5
MRCCDKWRLDKPREGRKCQREEKEDRCASMRMLEGLDCGSPVSSQDLWAEICPCAPDAEEQSHEVAFSDSFLGSPVTETSHDNTCATLSYIQKPWAPLQDSEVYLASLERRLQKIKGQSRELTSKEMLHSLGQAKKECWDRFMQETDEPEAYVGTSDTDNSRYTVHPESIHSTQYKPASEVYRQLL